MFHIVVLKFGILSFKKVEAIVRLNEKVLEESSANISDHLLLTEMLIRVHWFVIWLPIDQKTWVVQLF